MNLNCSMKSDVSGSLVLIILNVLVHYLCYTRSLVSLLFFIYPKQCPPLCHECVFTMLNVCYLINVNYMVN
jgi:hypothetical protein